MEVDIHYQETAGKNADKKYQERNKYKRKIIGVDKAITITEKKLLELTAEIKETKDKMVYSKRIDVAKKWYSKFRWFFTSNGFLVVAGRDAKNNEQLVKKHMSDEDLYFHAEIHGAPHTVLKNPDKKEIPDKDRAEAASFAGMFSSAWKSKIFAVDVYSVAPDQVSKTANTGESVGTGAFVIRGKREYFKKINLKLAVGYNKETGLVSGPVEPIKQQSPFIITVSPGDEKKSDIVREIKQRLEKKGVLVSTEDIDSILPPGDSKLEK